MPKPCGHGKPECRPGSPYSRDQCRACWLYEHEPLMRRLWDGPGARPGDCVRLGRVLDRRGLTCRGCWVHACELHGTCVPGRSVAEGARSCQDCSDYQSEFQGE